jgi:hypothetical protein
MHEIFTDAELEVKADEVMADFNFEKVLTHMAHVNHKWFIEGKIQVPSVEQLRSVARSLLTKVIYYEKNCANIGTGGFTAYKMPWGLRLSFEIASS